MGVCVSVVVPSDPVVIVVIVVVVILVCLLLLKQAVYSSIERFVHEKPRGKTFKFVHFFLFLFIFGHADEAHAHLFAVRLLCKKTFHYTIYTDTLAQKN